MKVSELKALVWKARRNWTPSVSRTLGVQIARKLGRLCAGGMWWRVRNGFEGRERLVTLSVR
jgi:inorganic triphosphatase YgiF